jgi:predicted transcriptional regulator
MELKMLESGIKSVVQDMLTPTMDRLAKSGLKASILIAASRMPNSRVMVTEGDVLKAFQYVTQWREFAMEVMSGIGMSQQEKQIEILFAAIKRNPGVTRSELMRNYHLTKREADSMFDTLEQRGLIARVKTKGTERLTAIL